MDLWFGKFFVVLLLLFFVGQVALRQTFRIHELGLLADSPNHELRHAFIPTVTKR